MATANGKKNYFSPAPKDSYLEVSPRPARPVVPKKGPGRPRKKPRSNPDSEPLSIVDSEGVEKDNSAECQEIPLVSQPAVIFTWCVIKFLT